MKGTHGTYSRWRSFLATVTLVAVILGCGGQAEFPANPGYLRASDAGLGKLVVFDADTFDVYREVDLPPATVVYSHRMEPDPIGRIWVGYSQSGLDRFLKKRKSGVLIFSPEGTLEHELELECARPNGGIAFASGYAFIGCVGSGIYGQVVVVDTASLEVVKRFEKVHPPEQNPARQYFYMTGVAEVGGDILVVGEGNPPRNYQRVTSHSAPVTRIGVIDPASLAFKGYLTGLEPGLRVLSVQDVDGKAWLFNSLSHLEERPPRTDVYVMDPEALEIVEQFNLNHPFPTWSVRGDDEALYIFHWAKTRFRENGYRSGITRLDPTSRKETFIPTPDLPDPHGIAAKGERLCLVTREKGNGGLWCLNDQGDLELKISQESSVGALLGTAGR